MFEILNAGQIASLVSIIAVAFVMVGGTVAPTIMEGKIAVKAIEGISRQPDAAGTNEHDYRNGADGNDEYLFVADRADPDFREPVAGPILRRRITHA